MPSELQRIAQELLTAIERIPAIVAHLHELARQMRQQAAAIATMQSANPNARYAALHVDAAARACEEAAHHAAQVPPRATAWVQEMVSGHRTATARPAQHPEHQPPPDQPGKTSSSSKPSKPDRPDPRLAAEKVRDQQRRLPIRQSREKTRGIWTNSDGTESPLISGKDDPYHTAADQHALKLGIGPLMTTAHVEIKFAMFMRERGLTHESIVINNIPCNDGPLSCEDLLKDFLPKSSKTHGLRTGFPAHLRSTKGYRVSYTASAYYRRGHRDQPVRLESPDDVDAMIKDLLSGADGDNSVATVHINERALTDRGYPDHELRIAINAPRQLGALRYMADLQAWYAKGSLNPNEQVEYFFTGHDEEWPRDSDITIDLIRNATEQFLQTGGSRPTTPDWAPWPA